MDSPAAPAEKNTLPVLAAVREFCEKFLTQSRGYRGSVPPGAPLVPPERAAVPASFVLVYQDGTACSASYAFADVYREPDGSLVAIIDSGQARSTGGNPGDDATVRVVGRGDECGIVDGLSGSSGHDLDERGGAVRAVRVSGRTNECDIVDALSEFSGHAPNECGALVDWLSSRQNAHRGWLDDRAGPPARPWVTRPWFRGDPVPVLARNLDSAELAEAIRYYTATHRPYGGDATGAPGDLGEGQDLD